MTNSHHKDFLVYFLVSDMFVITPHGKRWNYALFDWERNYIDHWVGLEANASEWVFSILKKLNLPWNQIRCLHRTDWENEK